MTERSGEQHVDLAAIQADDALLDALGRGEPAPDGDDLADLLVAWRAELTADLPSTPLALPNADTVPLPVSAPPPLSGPPPPEVDPSLRPAADPWPLAEADPLPLSGVDALPLPGADALPLPPADRLSPRRRGTGLRRGTGFRRALVGAVAAAVLLGGAALGAQRSGPDGPLWPITRVLYPQLVDVREAEHAIAQAHDAANAGRYDDARHFLDVASAHAARVTDRSTRQRLRDQIDQLRRSLPAAGGPTAGTSPTPPTAPGVPTPTPAPTPAPTAPVPAPPQGTGGAQPPPAVNPVPGLKSLLPSLPVPQLPLPSLPLPSLPLPPLPTLPGLGR